MSDKIQRYLNAYNSSFFNTNRTVKQRIRSADYPETLAEQALVEEPATVGR